MPKTKYLIVKGLDGLGSNIKMLYSCLFFSRLYDLKIILDWRNYSNYKNTDLFNKLFDNKNRHKDGNTNFELITDDFKSTSYYPEFWNNENIHFDKIPKYKFKSLVISNSTLNKNINKYETIVAISKFFPVNLDRYIIKNNLILKPSKLIKTRVDKFYNEHLNNKYKINIHYRHGNGELYGKRNSNMTGQYVEKINRIIKKLKKEYVIFVSTDSENIQKFFDKKYPNKCKYIDKWFPNEKQGPLHYNAKCDDMYKNILDSVTDLYLLSKYDYLICGYSNFSNQAILISRSNDDEKYKAYLKINNVI